MSEMVGSMAYAMIRSLARRSTPRKTVNEIEGAYSKRWKCIEKISRYFSLNFSRPAEHFENSSGILNFFGEKFLLLIPATIPGNFRIPTCRTEP